MHFKHTFGVIVHNGESFVCQAIESVYSVAHQIIVVEGCEPPAQFMATPDGLSVDGTEAAVKGIPDPQRKIIYVRGGRYSSKNDQCNVYMKHCTGDYIWELDSDELYHPEDVVAIDQMLFANEYEAAEIPFLHFWRDTFHIARGTSWEIPIRRIFKFQLGDRYATHRPPELARKTWAQMRLLQADALRAKGIFCYHYGFVDNQRTKWKCVYHCNRGAKFQDYFLEHWIRNTGRHYNNINQPVNTIEPFTGRLPDSILRSPWNNRKKISVLHVLPYWSKGGGCTCVRDLIYASNLGYFDHGLYIDRFAYQGTSPLLQGIPFYMKDFKAVAAKYDIVEIMFWKSMPELTALMSMPKRPKIVVIIPIFNRNDLRGSYDRFYLTDEEKKAVDHVVFMTDKAVGLPENKGIDHKTIIPWGPELIWPALRGYHWRTNSKKIVGYIGPFNPAVTHPRLPEVLKGFEANTILEMVGDGSMLQDFQKRVPKGQQCKWLGQLAQNAFWNALARWDVYTYPMKEVCYCGSELKIQEACASFVPLVIKPSLGLCDMQLEKCGIICNEFSEVPLAINEFLHDDSYRQYMQHSARVHALKTMGSHTTAHRMEDLYRKLV